MDVSSGNTKYKLAKNPVYSGTGRALVTCNAAMGANGTTWTIVPNADVANAGLANAGVANLYHHAHNGSLVLDGVYQQWYSVTATR